ncbi:MAG: amidohydrolase [Bryobacterales bacterium]|nr:amidohydrolase [Bryobacterales bacterium]
MTIRLLAILGLLAGGAFSQHRAELERLVAAERNSLEALYQHLHSHPELSYREKETAARLAQELRTAGYEVTAGVGGHGFVSVLKNGAGPTVLVRTDLDGLPVEEKSGLPYASKVKTTGEQGTEVSVMHACGHDVHMAAFIGAARMLMKMKDRWSGTLVLIGQPAEERGGGALAMLNDGLYSRFPRPDVALALHTDAALEAGKIGYRVGFAMANVDSVDLVVRGVGGHGAYPHFTRDPVVLAAQIILALQPIVSREVSPLDSAVITVGSIHGGTKHNIISDEVRMQLTVRSYSDQTREQLLTAIRRVATNTARAFGIPEDRLPQMTLVNDEFTPATYNDPPLVDRLLPVWKALIGDDNVVERMPEMGGEDFSRFGKVEPKIPIFLFRVGTIEPERVAAAKREGKSLPSLHSPFYYPAIHPTLETGAKAMTAAVLELMGKAGQSSGR